MVTVMDWDMAMVLVITATIVVTTPSMEGLAMDASTEALVIPFTPLAIDDLILGKDVTFGENNE